MDGYRPPIGYIVEGKMEYNCYLSLFARLNTGWIGKIYEPLWAGGNDEIIYHLDEHLRDLAKSQSPISVIVCVDFRDANRKHGFSCEDLKQHLETKASDWLQSKQVQDEKLPEQIIVVVVIQQFESWMLSDMSVIKNLSGFSDLGRFGLPDRWTNVDEDCLNPGKVMCQIFKDTNVKSPKFAKKIISKCNIDTMKSCSNSFRKFSKESKNSIDFYNQL